MTDHVFVAIGDTHLQHTNPRNPDRLRALDQILNENLTLPNLAAWLWPGDLFHARSSPQDRLEIVSRLARMADRAPVVICRGNHDQPGDLDIFRYVKAAHQVHVITSAQTLRVRLATDAWASLWVFSYPFLASLVAAGVASPDLFQTARAVLEDMFDFGAAELADARARGDLTLLMGHCAIGGARMSNGQPAIGREVEADGALLAKFGAIPKLLNHIHEPQEIHGAHFIGSITAQDFGEITPRRYLRVVMRATYWDIDSRPLDTPRLFHVEGRLTREGFEWQVVTTPGEHIEPPASWGGCDVRVRYRMRASERPALDESLVVKTFAGARRVQLDPIIESDRQVRAPEVAIAHTLQEKVTVVLESNGLPMIDARRAKLAALEHQPADLIVAGVQMLITERLGQSMPRPSAAPVWEEALL